jgi:hypothetical protein
MTVAGCSRVGIDPVGFPDAGDGTSSDTISADVGNDVALDTGVDADQPDTAISCSAGIVDGICPPECTQDEDIDCCEADSFCSWSVDGCGCAVEGPFAPPSTRTGGRR